MRPAIKPAIGDFAFASKRCLAKPFASLRIVKGRSFVDGTVSLSGEYRILFLRPWREKLRIPVGPGITVERIGLCYAHPGPLCFAMFCYALLYYCYVLAMNCYVCAMPRYILAMFLLCFAMPCYVCAMFVL